MLVDRKKLYPLDNSKNRKAALAVSRHTDFASEVPWEISTVDLSRDECVHCITRVAALTHDSPVSSHGRDR